MAREGAIGPARRLPAPPAALLVLVLDGRAMAAPLPARSVSEEERLANYPARQEQGFRVCAGCAIVLIVLLCIWLALVLMYEYFYDFEDCPSLRVKVSSAECVLCIAEASMSRRPAGPAPCQVDVELGQASASPASSQPPLQAADDKLCEESLHLAPVMCELTPVGDSVMIELVARASATVLEPLPHDCVMCELTPVGDSVMSELVPVNRAGASPARRPLPQEFRRASGKKASAIGLPPGYGSDFPCLCSLGCLPSLKHSL